MQADNRNMISLQR